MRNLLSIMFAFVLVFSSYNAFSKEAGETIPLTFSGYVVTEGTANFGDNGGDNANNFYTFSDDESTFTPSAQLGVSNDYFVIDALFELFGNSMFCIHQNKLHMIKYKLKCYQWAMFRSSYGRLHRLISR